MTQSAPPGRLAAKAFETACRGFLRWGCSLSVIRQGPLPDGPFLLCSNHQSHADSVALMVAADLSFGDCGLLAARDYFFDRPLRRRIVSSVLRLVPVERKLSVSGYRRVIEDCRALLAERIRALIIYPEGTRQAGGEVARFKRLAAILAASFDLPVVPAFISGTDGVLPRHAMLPRRALVEVRLGAPIDSASLFAGQGLRARSEAITLLLEQKVRALSQSSMERPWH